MPASISLSGLFWSTPDGTPFFTDLNLTFGPERTGIVGRNGSGKSTLLRLISGDLRPASGQLQVSGTIAMMRQEAMRCPDDSVADLFGVRSALDLLGRAEAGLAQADELADADWTLPARIEAALLRCGLSAEPQTPLATLSGGQRSRAALAALILAEPDFLLLDEPTNNLDRAGRKAARFRSMFMGSPVAGYLRGSGRSGALQAGSPTAKGFNRLSRSLGILRQRAGAYCPRIHGFPARSTCKCAVSQPLACIRTSDIRELPFASVMP